MSYKLQMNQIEYTFNSSILIIIMMPERSVILILAAYEEIVVIPQGAVHIKVEETVISRNYLGMWFKNY